MAQSAKERRAAQRKLAKEIKAGTYKPISHNWALPKAARTLGYSKTQWAAFEPLEREQIRNEVRNAENRVNRFINRPPDKRRGSSRPRDWETWEWELYKEGMVT